MMLMQITVSYRSIPRDIFQNVKETFGDRLYFSLDGNEEQYKINSG